MDLSLPEASLRAGRHRPPWSEESQRPWDGLGGRETFRSPRVL